MKKAFLFGILVSLLTVNIFTADNNGTAIGTAFRSVYGFGPGLLLKTPILPIHWGMNVGLNEAQIDRYLSVSMTGDYHIFEYRLPVDKNVVGLEKFDLSIGCFIGVGIQWGFIFNDERNNIEKYGVGGRVPLGFFLTPMRNLDLITEIAPGIGMKIFNSGLINPDFNIGVTVGFRYWL
jgi:hypothetical protein